MASDGQEEERPDDESEGIHYFDFSDPFGPAGDETDVDPFASEGPTVRGTGEASKPPHPKPEPPAQGNNEASTHDAFEFALTGLPDSATPAAHPPSDPSAGEDASEDSDVTFSSLTSLVETGARAAEQRAQFVAAFDAARADSERPFLAVALRMPASSPASARFPAVERGIRSALHPSDVLLADPKRRRLVAVLPGRSADAIRALFTHLMAYLRDHVPEAEAVGRAIEVLAAPGGRPFQRAADFLAATFDGP